MKAHHGFISNSSVTSFIIAFPKEVKSPEDVKEMLFGNAEYFPHPLPQYNSGLSFETLRLAEDMFWKLREFNQFDMSESLQKLNKLDPGKDKAEIIAEMRYCIKQVELATNCNIDYFNTHHPGWALYTITYDDGDFWYGFGEDIFKLLPHHQIDPLQL
jgi:hypothetical protein